MQLPLFQETHEPDFEALTRCLRAEIVGIDIETETRWTGIGPKADFGLSYPADVTVIALAWLQDGEIETTALAAPFDQRVLRFVKTLIGSDAMLVAHNAVFDFRQISKLTEGRVPARIWDTQSMARLIHPAINASYSLVSVARMLRLPVPEQQQALKSQRGKLHTLPLETQLAYAEDDAKLALQICFKQQAMPWPPDLIDWEIRALHEYCRMAAEGIRLNTPFVEQRLAELGEKRDAIAARLRDDGLYTPGSSQARAKYLYEQKGLPLPDPGETRFFTWAGRKRLAANPHAPVELSDLSTRSSVIESYMEDGSPYADRLRDLSKFMEIDWLMSTLNGLIDHAALDGRLHSLVTTATESGRRASSYPHMQNWKMPAMAGVAVGDEGFTLVEIDFSNAENVMAAYIASDSNLAAACAAEDFHSTMAQQYFGTDWEIADTAERKRLRNLAKKITYGTAYGMGAERLGQSIDVSTNEALRLMRAKDAAFANVTRSRESAKRATRNGGGILELWTGRKVAVPTAFVAWNYLCQGGVSEVLKRAIVRVSEECRARGLRSRVALDMHDALILEIAHDEWDEALSLASDIMTTITPDNDRTDPPIRWRAEPKIEENRKKWGARQWHPHKQD